ncbi:helix-turn-helix domain-containing protein [Lactococcus lactis]|uniref:helix-turn-helix domain-containing protein n=2 Tax=Lactococcus lactis TaxID=1358 RepID=UPI00211D5CFD|nr:helix-turn-helix transcriptional regulator [Lactococcus lactis]
MNYIPIWIYCQTKKLIRGFKMLPDRLKELRLERGLTQQKVADRLNVSQPNYRRWETGERSPSSETLKKLADFFNVSTDFLLGRYETLQPKIFYKRLVKLAKERKLTLWEVESNMGYPNNYLNSFQFKEPNKKIITELSKYFSVNEDYLSGKTTINNNKQLIHYKNEVDKLFFDFKENFSDLLNDLQLKEWDRLYDTETVQEYLEHLHWKINDEAKTLESRLNYYEEMVEERKHKDIPNRPEHPIKK